METNNNNQVAIGDILYTTLSVMCFIQCVYVARSTYYSGISKMWAWVGILVGLISVGIDIGTYLKNKNEK